MHGVSGAQLFLLREIATSPGISLNGLVARAMAGQSTVSEVIARLVERRLVRRAPADDDARRVALTLTRRGQTLAGRQPPTAQERLVAGLESLTSTEQQRLATALELWLDRAGFTDVEPSMFFEELPAQGTSLTRRRRAAVDAD